MYLNIKLLTQAKFYVMLEYLVPFFTRFTSDKYTFGTKIQGFKSN